MSNVAHSSLTGSQLHEPKGADTAALGTVYVANGAGSGSWNSIGTSAFTGMIADFAAPVAPAGWLELDGTVISTSTYSALYAVMSMQTSGTRTNGSAIITSVPSTTNLRVGYYVFGTGIVSGSTIVSIDSASQITISNTATSSGSATFAVSPWLLNTGTIQLPDCTTAGRFRRSRTSTTKVGDFQTSQNLAHTHGSPITSSTESAPHTHTFSGNTGTESASHTHNYSVSNYGNSTTGGGAFAINSGGSTALTGSENQTHTHAYSGTTSTDSVDHTHTVTIASDGGTEARPVAMVVLTCIKT